MLPLLDFTITLNDSTDYVRCAFLIHLLAIITLLRSSLPLLLVFSTLPLIIFLFITIHRSKRPMPAYLKLTYHPGYWLLHKSKGQLLKYEQASISFDGGLFFYLNLTGINSRKNIIIFKDQIDVAQFRVLKLMTHERK